MLRVPNSVSYQTALTNINNINKQILDIQEKLSTGKKLIRPEDDPVGSYLTIRYRSALQRIKKHIDIMNKLTDELNTTDSSLDQMGVILRRLKDLAINASNGTLTHSDREDVLKEVIQLRDEFISVANSKFEEKYIFSGGAVFEKPFTMIRVNNENQIKYNGDTSTLTQKITDVDSIEKNIPGVDLFFDKITEDTLVSDLNNGEGLDLSNGSPVEIKITQRDGAVHTVNLDGIFNNPYATVKDVLDAINNQTTGIEAKIDPEGRGIQIIDHSLGDSSDLIVEDSGPNNVATQLGIAGRSREGEITGKPLQNANNIFKTIFKFEDALKSNSPSQIYDGLISKFEQGINKIANYRATIGARVNRLETTKNRLDRVRINMENLIGKVEDVDVSEAVVKLQQLQISQKLALQVGASIMKLTLMDYL